MRATPALRRSVLKVLDQDVQRTFHFGDREPKTGHIMHMTATIPGIFDMATGKLVAATPKETRGSRQSNPMLSLAHLARRLTPRDLHRRPYNLHASLR